MTAYANTLEQWFYSLPALVQEVLQEPFTWMNDVLKSVAGHPDALLAAVPHYLQYADTIRSLGAQQLHDRTQMNAYWSGDAQDAFSDRMHIVEAQLAKLAEAVTQIGQLLESGAKATADAADMIIDIAVGLIMLALRTIPVNVALSVITAGTTLAAGVAYVIAEAARRAARIVRVLERTAQILDKIADMLTKLKELMPRIADALRKIKSDLAEAKARTKTATGMEKVRAHADFQSQKAAVVTGISVATGGTVQIPTAGDSLYQAGQEYIDGRQHAADAK